MPYACVKKAQPDTRALLSVSGRNGWWKKAGGFVGEHEAESKNQSYYSEGFANEY